MKYYPNESDIYASIAAGKEIDSNEDSMYSFIEKKISPRTEIITSSQLSRAVFSSRNNQKFTSIFMYNSGESNKELALFKAFSGENMYMKKVDFISLENPTEKLLKLMKVKQLPANVFIFHNKIDEEGFKQQSLYKLNYIDMRKLTENVSVFKLNIISM